MPPTTQVNIHQLQDTLDTYFTIPTSLTIETHFLQTTEHQSNQNNLQKPIKYRHVMCTVMFSLSDPPPVSNSCTPLDPILAKTCCDPTAVLKHVQPFNVLVTASDGGTVNRGGSFG